jgi:RNA ligase (TIGR02306 family)
MSLATIQRIAEINPIPNADNIEIAKVLGWNVVVRKEEFKVGDLCIYIEIDSLLPRQEWSEFLFKDDESTKYRLRTIKLRKQISQGLVISLNILGHRYEIEGDKAIFSIPENNIEILNLGDDVTELLGIEKYEKFIPAQLQGIIKGNFPYFLRKTDEVRIQSEPELLEQLKGKPYYITKKLDGTSATYYKFNNEFGVCSRNLELKEDENNTYWKIAYKYKLNEIIPEGYAFQGEICGPGIQGNKSELKEIGLFLFNVWDINKFKYIRPHSFGLSHEEPISDFIPIVERIEYGDKFNYTQEDLMKLTENQKYDNNNPAEGIVVRGLDQTISFKVVNNKFLLKYGE